MTELGVFISCVSAEFRGCRDVLREDLERPNVSVKVQEDFIATGTETLDLLDEYIRRCAVVIHLVGGQAGALALPPSVAWLRDRYPDLGQRFPALAPYLVSDGPLLPYTQWEAWLALYHGKRLLIAVPEPGPAPGVADAAQQAHLDRLAALERHPGIRFASADRLAVAVWRSGLLDELMRAGLVRRVLHLPYPSLGALLKGRDELLEALAQRFGPVPRREGQPAAALALTGLGGVGKTRLALEHAWRQTDEYPSRLLVSAASPESLHRNLAALCGSAVLDLPAKEETDEERQLVAVLAWLRYQPGWLLVLDNVDTAESAEAVEALLPRLAGGHVLITGRVSNWSGAVKTLPVDVLSPAAAAEFLLLRTQGRRRVSPDDAAVAATLAAELGYLALALEQAGAYVAHRQSSLAQYLAQWAQRRDEVLAWFNPRLMQYPASVAITWQASFDQLSPGVRRLLQRLAWLAPEPIPESLLDVPVPGRAADEGDPWDALAELAGYSLVTRDRELPVFSVHRLVQEVTRRGQKAEEAGPGGAAGSSLRGAPALRQALDWVDDGFVGETMNVRSWPVLEPLAPHAQAVARYADEAGIADATVRLFSLVGLLLYARARHAEAEPLMRRALALVETSFGKEHLEVATQLNNLAQLLQTTNRLAEAESLLRRALDIDKASLGEDHPQVAIGLNNLAALLQSTYRLAEAEPLMRRALLIGENCSGTESPSVAIRLSNLAQLLQDTDRLAEAEPLMRRALAIDESSFGKEHSNVATRLANLAQLLQTTNRLAEAEPLMRRALAIDEASFGKEHPRVATQCNNLAGLLQATNRLAEAEPLLLRALTIDETTFGKEHPDVARDLNNLALQFQATNRPIDAEPLIRRALGIFIASLGAGHPYSNKAKNNYTLLLRSLGRTEAEIERMLADLGAGG
jgi:tetratricopeptide (TPR) repeat protein